MSATSTRRTILAGAATLPALTVPALAVTATSGCTLPSDLIERFLRVRAWFLEKHAQESLHSAEVDRRFYEASGITRAEYFDMAADDPRREELNALNIKVSKQDDREEVDEYGQTEADRLCDERWDVAETHRPCGKQTLPNLEFVHDAPLHKKIKHRERITFKGETKIGAPSSCTEGVPFFDNGAFVYW